MKWSSRQNPSSSLPWSIQVLLCPRIHGRREGCSLPGRTNLIGAYPEQPTEARTSVIILDMEDGLINTDSMAPFSLPSEG